MIDTMQYANARFYQHWINLD